jgi:hypothetical protein
MEEGSGVLLKGVRILLKAKQVVVLNMEEERDALLKTVQHLRVVKQINVLNMGEERDALLKAVLSPLKVIQMSVLNMEEERDVVFKDVLNLLKVIQKSVKVMEEAYAVPIVLIGLIHEVELLNMMAIVRPVLSVSFQKTQEAKLFTLIRKKSEFGMRLIYTLRDLFTINHFILANVIVPLDDELTTIN